ncbi:MAG: hypothetical protein J6C84_09925 [Lachnospiraceae bacterium]|nr:hypothetical protein [Lachnospiraceae bacterium]
MALYYLTRDEGLTPAAIAEYSMKNGYYVKETGTAWALIEDVPVLYGISVEAVPVRQQDMQEALERGDILICSMKAGDFMVSGHFIVIYGSDEEGFGVNDSNCVARSRQSWTFEQLKDQIKKIWALGK